MRFEVLGPLTVRTDEGTPVPVPEAKVRALLGALLVRYGRPVPVDRLIDELWGEDLPGNPGNTLQTKVSQLRRILAQAEEGGRALVGFGPAGYALRVADAAVDAGRFAELTALARKEEGARARAALLSEALGLWRGPAYADLPDAAFVRPEVARLEERRVTAQEDLAEARLELGEHVVLADELAALIAEHPLRQRLRAAQMRALYGAGRQNEALAAYRELTARFAEELGIDPGPELGALHEAILRQDPELTAGPQRRPEPEPEPEPGRVAAPGSAPVLAPAVMKARRPEPATNLPTPVGSLVGREEAVARVCAAVEASRLVTLTGPGGVGKTRLALAAAARLAQAEADADAEPGVCPDGVRFVELAGARGGVVAVIAAALGVREDADSGAGPGAGGEAAGRDRLAAALAARRLLLVLDNCEHVVESVAALTDQLLRQAPGLRVLATSQEPLALSGEVLEAVAPLDAPEAMELFAARAAAGTPGFTLGPHNAEAVALVCRRLDGLPLALELAATRVRALGVHALAERLHDRFRLLNQVRRDAPARQRTLRAMIDWSWELLAPPERAALRRLAVFSGGFTLESAEAVCAAGDTAAEDVLDLLTRLVDCSLVVAPYGGGEGGGGAAEAPRHRMLESVTAYGLERLDEAGEAAAVRLRHAEHFAGLAERAAAHLHGPEQRGWLRRLDSEGLNLRAALDRAVEAGAAGTALRLANASAWYWCLRGRIGDARTALESALACASTEGRQVAPVAPVAPAAPGTQAGSDVAGARTRLAAFAVFAGDDSLLGGDFEGADPRGRWLLEFARLGFTNRPEADRSAADEDVLAGLPAVFRSLGDRWGEAAALSGLATRALYRGDLVELRRNAEAGARLFAELGDEWGRLQASEQLGILAEIGGDYPEAARLHEEGVRSARELELFTQVSFRLARQGRIALLTGDTVRAADLHEQARRLAAEQAHRPALQFAEIGLALGARREGDLDAAEARLLPWLDWNRRLGVDIGVALILAQLGYVAELRGDAPLAETLHQDGLAAARRSGDPRALALAFEGLAGAGSAAAAPGDRAVAAAELLGTAAELRESLGTPLPAAERQDVDRATARLRARLGDEAFACAFARGRALSPQARAAALIERPGW
ncbi:BTAD domain-containing putative transcriptional regulator [Streptomyces sp. NRRL S-237]|uniref:BTAD domain-containing putative transcriptional regulator n=1 Tax=Streptomyces sp. NRRL S-237 TaxID=1463895 RepID=UPI0004CACFAE|nr:BTAD domain-containing putative transcriptional regulator [Streptomyces sp. NRRL S-237]